VKADRNHDSSGGDRCVLSKRDPLAVSATDWGPQRRPPVRFVVHALFSLSPGEGVALLGHATLRATLCHLDDRIQPDSAGTRHAPESPENRSSKPQTPPQSQRRLPESNRCKRLCRPLRSHSAKAPRLDRSVLGTARTCRTSAGQLKPSLPNELRRGRPRRTRTTTNLRNGR
jgi:hypothetical protein